MLAQAPLMNYSVCLLDKGDRTERRAFGLFDDDAAALAQARTEIAGAAIVEIWKDDHLLAAPLRPARQGDGALRLGASRAIIAACIATLAACAPAPAPQPPTVLSETVEAVQGQTIAGAARSSFIVRFIPSHLLGRAQWLQGAGRHEEAERLVGVALRNDEALRGLCFERFTLGGAEIVLNVCAPSPWEEPLVTQRRWLAQLGATPSVAYVERNLVAQREQVATDGS